MIVHQAVRRDVARERALCELVICLLECVRLETYCQSVCVPALRTPAHRSVAQGGTYEGDWEHRAPHGQGRMVYSDGSVYVGGWKDFKFHGRGKLVQEGGVVFEGEWREGCLHGPGSVEARKLH